MLPAIGPRTGDILHDPFSLIGWLDRLYQFVKGGSIGLGTSVATTSGTTLDFTGFPSNTRLIIINMIGVSFNAGNQLRIQIGDSSGVSAAGYTGAQSYIAVASASATAFGGAGFDAPAGYAAADAYNGQIVLCLEKASTFTWTCAAVLGTNGNGNSIIHIAGCKSLSATLDRVRITTAAGATFDAGEINVAYALGT